MITCGQIRWDGQAGDGKWNNPLNWVNDVVPSASDEVILDNEWVKEGYTVTLPSGSENITVASVRIFPSGGNRIELALPKENNATPAFVATGPGFGLRIEEGGIFRNASGAVSGMPVSIADSIRISNGGRYIHQSGAGHAANVQVLSAAPGTETGIMEFDSPDLSATLSFSARTFGKLVLKAEAAGGTLNYTAAGTNRVIINSDLEIGAGVTCSLNFTDTLFIRRDFIQKGGTLNLGNASRSVVLSVRRHFLQQPGGILTETGTAEPVVLLCGDMQQQIAAQGAIRNNICWKIHSAGGAVLISSLFLPARLEMSKGKLTTTAENGLTLLPGCRITADSLSDESFIEGPVRKEGLVEDNFLFPVGYARNQRWLQLRKATGNFEVSYHRLNPYTLSVHMGAGIDHVSGLEYWTIDAKDAIPASGAVRVSFNDPNSGGVTSLGDLLVSRLINGQWQNAGNAGTTGSPGANGSVTSLPFIPFASGKTNVTLASSAALSNPLPLGYRSRQNRPGGQRIAGSTFSIALVSTIVQGQLVLLAKAEKETRVTFFLSNGLGVILQEYPIFVRPGQTPITLDVNRFPGGLYHIFGLTSASLTPIFRFYKR